MNYARHILLSALLVAVFVPVYAHAGVIAKPTNNIGLVGYWPLNEGTGTVAGDYSGNGKIGTLSGTTLPTWVAGVQGKALSFDGSTSYINFPSFSMKLSQATFSAWVYRDTSVGYGEIIFSRGTSVSGMNLNSAGTNIGYTWNNGNYLWNSGLVVPTGRWVFVAVTIEPTQAVAYLYDPSTNLFSSSTNAVSHIASTINALQISGSSCCGNRHFNGSIDDARIYSRAFSASEVQRLYQQTISTVKVGASSAALGGASSLANGLVGLWTFDGADVTDKVYDKSGNSNNGYFAGTATTSAATIGKLGQALKFNGTTDYVTFGNIASISALPVSISVWFKPLSFSGEAGEMIVQTNNPTASYYYCGVQLLYTSTTIQAQYGNCGGTSSASRKTFSATVSLTAGTWYHVVMVGTSLTDAKLYINGVLQSTSNSGSASSVVFNSQPAVVGLWSLYNLADRYSNMVADDVRIYNRALSASEVAQLYAQGGAKLNSSSANLQNGSSLASGLVGLWTFDGKDVTDKVYDRSGQGNNGYFVGTATTSATTIGKMGQAFISNSTYVLASPSFNPQTTDFTLAAWVYITSIAASDTIFSQENGSGTGRTLLAITTAGKVSTGLANGGFSPTANSTLSLNKWYHVVMVKTGTGDLTYYVNGVNDGTDTRTVESATGNIRIGASKSGTQFLKGKIDDARLYTRALSASEVMQLYTMGR